MLTKMLLKKLLMEYKRKVSLILESKRVKDSRLPPCRITLTLRQAKKMEQVVKCFLPRPWLRGLLISWPKSKPWQNKEKFKKKLIEKMQLELPKNSRKAKLSIGGIMRRLTR